MVELSAGEIVFIPFPFSDLSKSKLRPAVVLAAYTNDDYILCQITSKPYADRFALELSDSDFITGSLLRVSYARPGKLFTAHSSLIVTKVGVLKKEIHNKVIESVISILYGEKTQK